MKWSIETRPVKELKEWGRNPRKLTKKGLEDLEASIREFGLAEPLVINVDGTICGGHGRKKILQRLKIKECDCYVPAEPLTETEFKRLNIRLNKNVAGIFDFDILSSDFDVDELLDLGFLEDGLGIDADVIEGKTEPDDIPDAPPPVTVKGDIWLLGKHRIMCGDSTSADDVDKLLDGVKPHLMVTDPPYGVEYDADWRNKALGESGSSVGKVENDNKADWREAWALFPGDVTYVWHAGTKAGLVAESLEACGFQIRTQIIWAKQHFAIGRGHYHVQHEPCWYAVKQKGHWNGDRKQSTVWNINNALSQGGGTGEQKTGHSTQKPVECMRKPIENNSSEGQAVYEPFCGSGTTIIAAEQTNRTCYAMEISEEYVDIAVKRWEDFTGEKAVHAKTGKSFDGLDNVIGDPI